MIPVRVPSAMAPVLAHDRRFEVRADHPLAFEPCPACEMPLSEGGPVVLVFVGIAPRNRKEAGWTQGGAVAVHDACAAGASPAPQEKEAGP